LAGYSVAMGDIDNDGYADLLIGARNEGAYLLMGAAQRLPETATLGTDLGDKYVASHAWYYAGSAVARAVVPARCWFQQSWRSDNGLRI
jgi:hypothetical protein